MKKTAFEAKIRDFIERHALLEHAKRYLVALSGGADSVCLLLVLQRLGYEVEAAHCNFHLRGEASDRDAAFCESLCKQKNIPFHRADFETAEYAKMRKLSIEMAARELRYTYFNRIVEKFGLQGVCTAHHADDQAETILLHLLRGTGLHGLTGMSPRRGPILRPMLEVTRDEIEEYLTSLGQNFMTDQSNFQSDFTRNKIRLEIVPKLKEINPSVVQELNLTARHLRDAELVLDDALRTAAKEICTELSEKSPFLMEIDLEKLLRQPSPAYALHHLLAPRGFNRSQIDEIRQSLTQQAGRQWHSPDHTLTLDRNRLLLSLRNDEETSSLVIGELGNHPIDEKNALNVEIFPKTADFIVSKAPNIATLDADKVVFPLTLRLVQEADRFVPFGMACSRLVSNYLTDRKRSLPEKRRQRVVTDATGRIVWLVGERTDNRFRVMAQTESILRLTLAF